MADTPSVTIPDKPAFKAGEVCEIAQIQPYVLRSWESEFPDLGLSKTPGGPRVYRRSDVERVLRIRDLVFTEGLTLSGVRRRFESEQPAPQDDLFTLVAEIQAAQASQAQAAQASQDAQPAQAAQPAQVARPAQAARPASSRGRSPPPSPGPEVAPPAPVESAAAAPVAVEPGVREAAREQIGKLKQEMRSLLEMLGGGHGASGGAASPDAPRKRPRRA